MDKTLYETISDALSEAHIMEFAMDTYDKEHMLYTAQVLSGAPYSFVKEVFLKNFMKSVDITL